MTVLMDGKLNKTLMEFDARDEADVLSSCQQYCPYRTGIFTMA